MENPFVGVFLIILGTVGYFHTATYSLKHENLDNILIKGYSGSIMSIILGLYILGELLLFNLGGFVLLICSVGLLIYGFFIRRIGGPFHLHNHSLLIFVIVSLITSFVLIIGSL